MQTIVSTTDCDLTIDRDSRINGYVKGNITVSESVTLLIHGEVVGDIRILNQAKVCIYGAVIGDVVNEGGELMVIGILSGELYDTN